MATKVWDRVSSSIKEMFGDESGIKDIAKALFDSCCATEAASFMAKMWAIWTTRNDICFNNVEPNVEMTVVSFERMVYDYARVETDVKFASSTRTITSLEDWKPPNVGWKKLNTDAALLHSNEIGLGRVIQNETGRIEATVVHRVLTRGDDVLFAEAVAMELGLKVARDRGIEKIIVESDNLSLIRHLTLAEKAFLSQ